MNGARQVMQMALDALEYVVEQGGGPVCEHETGGAVCFCKENEAINALRAALLSSPALPAAAMPVGELTEKVVNLPIPASAADLKSDIAELIQSHKYKGLRSIEVLGVFQFIGAEIISGSNS